MFLLSMSIQILIPASPNPMITVNAYVQVVRVGNESRRWELKDYCSKKKGCDSSGKVESGIRKLSTTKSLGRRWERRKYGENKWSLL